MKTLSDFRPSIQKTFRFIEGFIKENGYGPSLREMMNGRNLSSTSVATYHRDQLCEAGLLTYDEGRDRSIALAGSVTLTYYGDDAKYLREEFGKTPEVGVMDLLRQEVGVISSSLTAGRAEYEEANRNVVDRHIVDGPDCKWCGFPKNTQHRDHEYESSDCMDHWHVKVHGQREYCRSCGMTSVFTPVGMKRVLPCARGFEFIT